MVQLVFRLERYVQSKQMQGRVFKWHLKVPQKRFLKILWESLGWSTGRSSEVVDTAGAVSLGLFITICDIIDGVDGVRATETLHTEKETHFLKVLCL